LCSVSLYTTCTSSILDKTNTFPFNFFIRFRGCSIHHVPVIIRRTSVHLHTLALVAHHRLSRVEGRLPLPVKEYVCVAMSLIRIDAQWSVPPLMIQSCQLILKHLASTNSSMFSINYFIFPIYRVDHVYAGVQRGRDEGLHTVEFSPTSFGITQR